MSGSERFRGKRVLIGNHLLCGFTGSEIQTLEMAEYFRSHGAEVTLFSALYSQPMLDEIENLGFTRVGPWGLFRQKRAFDIVWAHHDTVFVWFHLIIGVLARQHLHGILSFQHKIENVPLVDNCSNLTLLANSEETRNFVEQRSDKNDIQLFLNIAPDEFFDAANAVRLSHIKRVAIVSNHPPAELVDAKHLLEVGGVQATIFGEGESYSRIRAGDLSPFDVVITIGKTVQYCLAQQKPVYIYDRFGGPGYLSPDNFEANRFSNFSGRANPIRRSAKQLTEEIHSGYPDAIRLAERFGQETADQFRINKQFDRVCGSLLENHSTALTPTARVRTLTRYIYKRTPIVARALAPQILDRITALRHRLVASEDTK